MSERSERIVTAPHDFDAITRDMLRARGGVKWTRFDGDVIGAFIAEMDFGTAPQVRAALHAAVDAEAFGYLPEAMVEALAAACAGWQSATYGWTVPAEWIRPLPDVLAGLTAAIEQFSPPGGKVVLPTPAYMPFLQLPGHIGREIIEVPMVDDGSGRPTFDLDGIAAAFRAGGALLVVCNPHNPLGLVHTREELIAVSEVVAGHGGRVFADEIHAPLVYAPAHHVPYASVSDLAAGHAVTATSASKAWNLPGLKCAQLILSNGADAARWGDVGFFSEHLTSTLGVVANTAAYMSGRAWLDGVVGYLDGNRLLLADLLAEHLPEVGYRPPDGTYLAWLDVRRLGLGDAPGERFAEGAGVMVVDGARCGTPGFVRVNFATPRPILAELVARMATAVR